MKGAPNMAAIQVGQKLHGFRRTSLPFASAEGGAARPVSCVDSCKIEISISHCGPFCGKMFGELVNDDFLDVGGPVARDNRL